MGKREQGVHATHHEDPLTGPTGTIYRRVSPRISSQRAHELLLAGATVVVDDCGCGDVSCLSWLNMSGRAAMAVGKPRLKKSPHARLEEWASESGEPLLLQNGAIRWA